MLRSKLTTILFNLSPCTLCTVQAHANVIENCILCILDDDGLPGFTFIFANMGSIGTALCSLANWLFFFLLCSVLLCHLQT